MLQPRPISTPEQIRARADERYRSGVYERLPARIESFIRSQAGKLDRIDYREANRYVGTIGRQLCDSNVHRAFDENAIRDYAENFSRLCFRGRSLPARLAIAAGFGLSPAFARGTTSEGQYRRLADARWWRRQLRTAWTRGAEGGLRQAGLIRKGREPYASDIAVAHRARQKARGEQYLKSHEAVSDDGTQIELFELAQRSLANPALRRGEFMVRARGFEEIAAFHKHVALFFTLTCPSRFHAQLAAGGSNPAHDRSTVRAAQQWLCKMWARARAKLKRRSVLFYGFRVAEPHHDATPHWHLLLFTPERHADTLEKLLRGVWLSEDGTEEGAEEHRCKIVYIDDEQGSATGYIAKYVAKNIDGAGAIGEASDEETDSKVSSGIRRVDTWASVHGIRQFQQLGGPAIGLYREFRRLRDPVRDADLERCRAPADDRDFGGFIHAVGGIGCGRRTNARLKKEQTGAINFYGEPRPPQTIGVQYASAVEITRPHHWRIQPCSHIYRGSLAGSSSATSSPRSASSQVRMTECSMLGRGGGGPSSAFTASMAQRLPISLTDPSALQGRRTSSIGSAPAFIDLGALPLNDRREADRAWSRLLSHLGPVAITVRSGDPAGWTNPNETSRAGP